MEGKPMQVYTKGHRVHQASYGVGTVTASDARHTVIDFDEHGVRTFSTPIVTLEPSSVAAPLTASGRPRAKRTKAAAAPSTRGTAR
jgi:hypothetical protein